MTLSAPCKRIICAGFTINGIKKAGVTIAVVEGIALAGEVVVGIDRIKKAVVAFVAIDGIL